MLHPEETGTYVHPNSTNIPHLYDELEEEERASSVCSGADETSRVRRRRGGARRHRFAAPAPPTVAKQRLKTRPPPPALVLFLAAQAISFLEQDSAAPVLRSYRAARQNGPLRGGLQRDEERQGAWLSGRRARNGIEIISIMERVRLAASVGATLGAQAVEEQGVQHTGRRSDGARPPRHHQPASCVSAS